MTLLSIIGAAYFWSGRARNARDAAEDIVHVASDVRLAFRGMGFKRKTNIHPVDAIEDNDQLTAIIAKAFVEKKGVVTLDDFVRLREALQNEFDCTDQRAEDLTIVADWAIRECGTVDAALSRIASPLQNPRDEWVSIANAGDWSNHMRDGPWPKAKRGLRRYRVDFSYTKIGTPAWAHQQSLCPRASGARFGFKAVD